MTDIEIFKQTLSTDRCHGERVKTTDRHLTSRKTTDLARSINATILEG